MPVKKPVSDKNNDQKENLPITENDIILKAHEQADLDIDKDPDLSVTPQTGDDLDEGELARLEGEE